MFESHGRARLVELGTLVVKEGDVGGGSSGSTRKGWAENVRCGEGEGGGGAGRGWYGAVWVE